MKKTFIPSLFALIAFMLLSVCASAQGTASAAPAELSATGAIAIQTTWLNSTDFAAVIAAERVSTAQLLSTPHLKQSDVALYQGYDRMLSYIQTDLSLNSPVDNLAGKNFDKVMIEIPNDPTLEKLQTAEFNNLYQELIVKLSRS